MLGCREVRGKRVCERFAYAKLACLAHTLCSQSHLTAKGRLVMSASVVLQCLGTGYTSSCYCILVSSAVLCTLCKDHNLSVVEG